MLRAVAAARIAGAEVATVGSAGLGSATTSDRAER